MIKILHMYHDLMNLYGDWANAVVLEHEFTSRGFDIALVKKSVDDDIIFNEYDIVVIGSGTERSQIACMKDLIKYKEAFFKCINIGTPVLATGNSHELFGVAVTDLNGVRHEMLGLLDFETTQHHTRVTGDCICNATFLNDKLIGFVNRAGGGQTGNLDRPFYIEPGKGANYNACFEGIKYKNLLGTYMTGPVLVRNPPLLYYFTNVILKEHKKKSKNEYLNHEKSNSSSNDPFFIYQKKAYETALRTL